MKLQCDFTKSRRLLSINDGRNFKQIDHVLVKLYTNGSAHALVPGTRHMTLSTHVYVRQYMRWTWRGECSSVQ